MIPNTSIALSAEARCRIPILETGRKPWRLDVFPVSKACKLMKAGGSIARDIPCPPTTTAAAATNRK